MEPKIRLKGFSGEWEKVCLENFATLKNGYAFQSTEYVPNSKYKVVTIANVQNGYLDLHNNSTIPYVPQDLPQHCKLVIGDTLVSMTGNVGRVCRVTSENCLLNQRVGKLIFKEDKKIDFVYTVLNSSIFENKMIERGQGGAQPNISKSDIERFEFSMPVNIEEQKLLSSYTQHLDSLIQSTTKKIESLKQVKAASLQSMFPQEGETTPRVRFKGYEEEWEKVSLKKYAKRINRKNKNMESTLALTISSIDGLVSQIDYFNNLVVGANLANYYLLKNGEFAYNKSYSRGYPFGSVKRLDRYNQGILSTLYIVFSINDEISSDYLARFFDTTLWHKQVAERAEEGARNHGLLNIGADDFMTIDIVVPTSRDEQQQIANYFTNLDTQITLQTQRLEKLKQIKSACLDTMFV